MCTISYRFDEKVLLGGNRRRDGQPDALWDNTMDVFYAGVDTAFDSSH